MIIGDEDGCDVETSSDQTVMVKLINFEICSLSWKPFRIMMMMMMMMVKSHH